MATTSWQLTDCEHCGSWVKVRPTCPKCGKEHSQEWLEENEKIANIADSFIAYPLIFVLSVWYIFF